MHIIFSAVPNPVDGRVDRYQEFSAQLGSCKTPFLCDALAGFKLLDIHVDDIRPHLHSLIAPWRGKFFLDTPQNFIINSTVAKRVPNFSLYQVHLIRELLISTKIATLEGHSAAVYSIARLASALNYETARLGKTIIPLHDYGIARGLRCHLESHTVSVQCVAFMVCQILGSASEDHKM